jgi:hypothetical protein
MDVQNDMCFLQWLSLNHRTINMPGFRLRLRLLNAFGEDNLRLLATPNAAT